MAKYENLKALFTAIATSIRNKTGGTDAIIADDFPEAIDGIQTGGGVDKIQRYIELNGNSTYYLFYEFGGTSVDELMDGVDTSKVSNMRCMFNTSTKLITIPFFDTRKASNLSGSLTNCSALTTVAPLDMRACTNMDSMFGGNKQLKECWLRNIKTNLQVGRGDGTGTIDYGCLLTLESLLHLCKECRNVNVSRKITVGTANLAKLEGVYVKLIDITDDMRAEDDLIDEKYPFVVCESTDADAMTIQDYMALKMWSLA